MNTAPVDAAVLSELYLNAVLPALSELTRQDPVASALLADLSASVVLRILNGLAVTLHLKRGVATFQPGAAPRPSVVLLFFSASHLNAFFAGAKWALPILIWGGWRIPVLIRFSRLADRLKAVLDGHESILSSASGRRLHARLSLMVAGLGLVPLAHGDPATRTALQATPFGLASFAIAQESATCVWFDHRADGCAAGWSDPPRCPEVRVIFSDVQTAFEAMRDQIDNFAAVGSGRIIVDGLVPLAEELSFIMQRLRVYLPPPPGTSRATAAA